ncbi:hypothetical protein [Francisella hispaniensis]|uniref:Uncharacterized protein n=1 Tax=Francisella hispaniensis FSC454 TaxID=1088883 RepID=A0AAC9J5W6_9GAMM|nr:hypothetical protein [Francisella hispaniensis]APD50163.1 hypothetical protein FSC454_02910 [Francisella hispaniensis FSC454]KYW82801.1 hypothetical protein AUF42_07215 [Francisella hispaniensis FSC454]
MSSKNSLISIAIQVVVALALSISISITDSYWKWLFVIIFCALQILVLYFVNKNITPIEKFRLYLKDSNNWDQNNDYTFFYKKCPEFTMKEIDDHIL